ncbi:uncharacterized protein EHS24_000347 [Apiotrichum porosum]|uniref:Cytochrome b561 domain-containing protein n=1 Tax=Apiotrichum porosum TaxID=105984 RepID=A0A427Y9J3_9TREE|nr:uncharacterized protein EHS24_000347 [Apiotrichum porosum]RSH87830.1 hypothetical protein EHS24_000347 [Apiotrichum porosum]
MTRSHTALYKFHGQRAWHRVQDTVGCQEQCGWWGGAAGIWSPHASPHRVDLTQVPQHTAILMFGDVVTVHGCWPTKLLASRIYLFCAWRSDSHSPPPMMLITPLLFSILSFVAAAQRTGETVCNSDQNLCVLAVPDTPTPVPNVPGSNLAARYQYGPGYGYPSTTQSSLPGYTTAPQPGYTQPSTEDSDARRPISNLLLAHIVCGCLATLLFIPLGILGPRVARTFTTSRLWFPAHASVQGLISTSLVVATYSCARVLTQQQDTSNLDSPHRVG